MGYRYKSFLQKQLGKTTSESSWTMKGELQRDDWESYVEVVKFFHQSKAFQAKEYWHELYFYYINFILQYLFLDIS